MLHIIFSDIYTNFVLFAKWIKLSIKKVKHQKKTWKSRGILSVRKSGNHFQSYQEVCSCHIRGYLEESIACRR